MINHPPVRPLSWEHISCSVVKNIHQKEDEGHEREVDKNAFW